MQRNQIKNIIISLAIITAIIVYTLFKSTVSGMPFLNALDVVTSNIITEAWRFVSTPTIFLGILVVFLILKFRNSIESVFPSLREFKAGSFSALFEIPVSPLKIQSQDIKISAKEQEIFDEKIVESFITLFGKRSCEFFLYLDDKSLSLKQVYRKMNEIQLLSGSIETDETEKRLYFYAGAFRTIWSFVVPYFYNVEVSESSKISHFHLKAGIHDKLQAKLKILKENSIEGVS